MFFISFCLAIYESLTFFLDELSYHMKDSMAQFIFTDEAHVNTVKQVKAEVDTLQVSL